MSKTALVKRIDYLAAVRYRLKQRKKGLGWTEKTKRQQLTKRINRAISEQRKANKVLKEIKKDERLQQDLDIIARSVRKR